MDKTGTQTALATAGLSQLTKSVDLLTQPSIRLYTTPVEEATLSIGKSKIGGVPDLPAGMSWPEWKGQPQSFIAQIRLDDVHQYDTGGLLPPHGLLWFFYDASQQAFGDSPSDSGAWRVLFMDGDLSKLQRASAPAQLPTQSRFHACAVAFASEITLTQQPELEIPNLNWSATEQQQYETVLSTLTSSDDRTKAHNRLLGYPDTIQDDMRLQCQLVSQGVTDANDPRTAALSKGALDWQLLLQIDSDEQAGMRWGNSGMLYYWIKRADLQTRHFDRTWLVLQSE
ncbi:MAG TPA: YwqG family protein [Ktedonobacteraceae bacterium]|nr:YwqG family protein [Ktedonobacteraceae bacterium]